MIEIFKSCFIHTKDPKRGMNLIKPGRDGQCQHSTSAPRTRGALWKESQPPSSVSAPPAPSGPRGTRRAGPRAPPHAYPLTRPMISHTASPTIKNRGSSPSREVTRIPWPRPPRSSQSSKAGAMAVKPLPVTVANLAACCARWRPSGCRRAAPAAPRAAATRSGRRRRTRRPHRPHRPRPRPPNRSRQVKRIPILRYFHVFSY